LRVIQIRRDTLGVVSKVSPNITSGEGGWQKSYNFYW